MTRDDIIRMARESGFQEYLLRVWRAEEGVERFAALVTAAEREACAKAIEQCAWPAWAEACDAREVFATAIRARRNT